jgi:hypothetical protein
MSRFTVGWAGVTLAGVDPYKSFRFRLKSDGHSVAGFGKCAGLRTSAAKPQPVRLERGVTRDQNFASWIGKPTETWGASKHKDLVVEIYNEAGQLAPSPGRQGPFRPSPNGVRFGQPVVDPT